MANWWEKGYPGGPMVEVKGFPRALYPPDANKHGKKPSSDGPDVVAYKRTVSRAGRWPWQTFDDTYSNGFAHGRSNVSETGMAGVQRQGDLDDTGWVGKNTFNLLRSIRIPEGLPHAGEPAMDAKAVDLINKAFDQFQGAEPPPEGGGTVRKQALNRAIGELGTKESPADSNQVKYSKWYGMIGPWCAMFVTWAYELGAQDLRKDSPSFVQGSYYAYVPYIVGDARGSHRGLKTVDSSDVMPGDLVCYDWGWDGTYDHVGLFERWTSGTSQFDAIEGNTSYGNNSNGGEVMRRSRSVSGQATVFVRVKEP
jgi:hypothetical protein